MVIVEIKPTAELAEVKHQVAEAIWKVHNLRVDDLVLVSPGSIPITTSGRSAVHRPRSCTATACSNGWTSPYDPSRR